MNILLAISNFEMTKWIRDRCIEVQEGPVFTKAVMKIDYLEDLVVLRKELKYHFSIDTDFHHPDSKSLKEKYSLELILYTPL